MSVPLDEILRIARLACLRLDPQEAESMRAQLARVLDYAARIDGIDVSAVEATTHAGQTGCPLRADEVEPSLDPEDVLSRAPAAEDARFRVPRFVG